MLTKDSKNKLTDCLDTKGVLRLVQSIPSPKAEPFKMWLAQVGSERLDEIADPEKAILRGADFYRAKGYTEGWINQRLQTIEMRKELTFDIRSCIFCYFSASFGNRFTFFKRIGLFPFRYRRRRNFRKHIQNEFDIRHIIAQIFFFQPFEFFIFFNG